MLLTVGRRFHDIDKRDAELVHVGNLLQYLRICYV